MNRKKIHSSPSFRAWICFCLIAALYGLPVTVETANALTEKISDDISFNPIQHASFVMLFKGKAIYVDPVGNAEVYRNYPKADLILITHEHGDHFNLETLVGVSNTSAPIVCPAVVAEKLGANIAKRVTVIANGDKKTVGDIPIEAIPAYNLTPERQRYHEKGIGNGYVITLGDKRIYISGDTEDIPEMKALKNIDAAFVCINLPYTMTVEQAAGAVRAFQPKIVYPYHSKGSDLQRFKVLVGNDLKMDVRILNWYE